MDGTVIFSKPLVWVLMALIVAAHIGDAVLYKLILHLRTRAKKSECRERDGSGEREYYLLLIKLSRAELFKNILAAANLALHLAAFIYMLFIKASPEEMLFLLMISVALALTVSRIKKEEV